MTRVKWYDRETNETLRIPNGTRTHGLPEYWLGALTSEFRKTFGVTRD